MQGGRIEANWAFTLVIYVVAISLAVIAWAEIRETRAIEVAAKSCAAEQVMPRAHAGMGRTAVDGRRSA